nr:MAG TPA: hypothetical protein [Crassvirales sp.]
MSGSFQLHNTRSPIDVFRVAHLLRCEKVEDKVPFGITGSEN